MDNDTEDAGAHRRRGSRQRDDGAAWELDLERLLPVGECTAAVEYLTAIQVPRDDASALLLVRDRDLDAMAARDDRPLHEFLDRLEDMGVVVSSN